MKFLLAIVSVIAALSTQAQTPNSVTLGNYVFQTPEGWHLQDQGDHILIQNMQSGCLIRILPPYPSSGDLQQDAKAVFDLMYVGWQYRNVGQDQYTLSKGFLTQGLEYCMWEGSMSQANSNGTRTDQDGAAIVVRVGQQVAIISVRHNSSFLAHTDCLRKYNTWRRFFNSFTVKNTPMPKSTGEESLKRIVGFWKVTEGMVVSDYVFAVNGNYQHGGAIGTTSKTSDQQYEYTHYRSYSFEGDGSYTVSGNQLVLKKHSGPAVTVQIRFDKANHNGRGWTDRLYMLNQDVAGMYEVCYEKVP